MSHRFVDMVNFSMKRLQQINEDMVGVHKEIQNADKEYRNTYDPVDKQYFKEKQMKLMDKLMKLIEERTRVSVASIEGFKLP